jgi:YD repeat-containing protein
MVDLRVPGPIPLELRRTYHTKYLYNGPLGFGWDFEYNQRLYRLSNTNLVLRRGHADSEEFTHDGGGGFSGPPGTGEAIQENLDGSYSLLRPDGMQFVYAFDGSLTRVEDVRGNQLLFSYDPAGKLPIQGLSNFSVSTNPVVVARDFRLVRIDEARNDVPSGRYLDFLYNDNGRVTNAMCHTGADVPDLEVSYSYDTNDTGNLVMYTDVEGLTFPYAYDDMHRLTNFFSGGCTCLPRSQQFDSEGRVIQQTIGNTVIDFEYLISGVRTRVTTHIVDDETLMFLRDRIEVFDFTPEGQVSQHRLQMGSQQDPGGGESDDLVTQYTYDSATEEILEKVNPDGAIEAFTYDFADRSLTREIRSSSETLTRHAAYDGLGNVTNEFMTWTGNPGIRFGDRAGAFDNEGRILTDTRIGTNGAQLVTSYSYGTNGTHEVVTITDPEGNRRRQEFDVRGNLVRDYDPDFPSIQTLYGYDSRGNRTNRIDALGFETRWEYDAKGRVTRETNPLLHESVFTYSDGNLIREERGIHGATPGRVLVHEYNASNHRVATHRVDDFGGTNLWMRWGYDSSGRVTYRENATGQRTKYVYDAANRRVSAENIYGGVTSNEFDKAGRVAMRIDAVGVTTRLQYDLAGLRTQRVEAVGTAMERTRSVRSDFPGRVTERIHPDGSITRYDYDAFGRLARIHGDREYGESLFYDGNGRLIAEIDGRGLATTNRYDEQGRLVEIVNPDATTQGIGYDLLGRMVSTTNENTNSTYMTYDALGRLLTRSAPNDSNAVLFAYTYSPWGDVTSVSNAAGGQEHATFDFAGRKVLTIDTAGLILSNTYDALDNRVLITWPNGTTISNTVRGREGPCGVRTPDRVRSAGQEIIRGHERRDQFLSLRRAR